MPYNLLGSALYAFGFLFFIVCCKSTYSLCKVVDDDESETASLISRYRYVPTEVEIDDQQDLPPKYEDVVSS